MVGVVNSFQGQSSNEGPSFSSRAESGPLRLSKKRGLMNDFKQRPKLLPHVWRGGVSSKQQLTESAHSGAGTSDESLAFSHCVPGNLPLVGSILGRGGNHCSHEINLWFITQRMGKGNWVTMTPQP